MSNIRSFRLEISDNDIKDLKNRLNNTRLPDQPPIKSWKSGTDLNWFKNLLHYWKNDYDWRKSEAELNLYGQFKMNIDEVDIHFIKSEGKTEKSFPLLLLHGWPGSVFEFIEIINILNSPSQFNIDTNMSYTVIAPSLPGFGLSFKPNQKRFGVEEMSDMLFVLMQNLGYEKFFIQGGDWGSMIGTRMAYKYSDNIFGLHLNMLSLRREFDNKNDISAEEEDYISQVKKWRLDGMGYQAIQGSKPQTLAYGLTDSPAGLAAWICEKFYEWTDCKGTPEDSISIDRMLANISLYWFTGAIGSSFWPYYARSHRSWFIPEGAKVIVPVGYCEFPKEMLKPQRKLAEKTYTNIIRWEKKDQGGHFAALENPNVLAKEFIEFSSSLNL
tara:strand:- start:11011 stop:12162 length:1152 start_codon:yes stop_codon:yes gene_type:complete